MSLKENVVRGWRSTLGGSLIFATCFAYYAAFREHLYYCVGFGFLGIGLIVNPDQIVPLFIGALKTVLDATLGRVVGLIGKKK